MNFSRENHRYLIHFYQTTLLRYRCELDLQVKGVGTKRPKTKRPITKRPTKKRPMQQNGQLRNAQCYKTPKIQKNALIPKNNKNLNNFEILVALFQGKVGLRQFHCCNKFLKSLPCQQSFL